MTENGKVIKQIVILIAVVVGIILALTASLVVNSRHISGELSDVKISIVSIKEAKCSDPVVKPVPKIEVNTPRSVYISLDSGQVDLVVEKMNNDKKKANKRSKK